MPLNGGGGCILAFIFCSFLLQNFHWSSARRVFIFTTQTKAGPKRPFHELSESPTPSAPSSSRAASAPFLEALALKDHQSSNGGSGFMPRSSFLLRTISTFSKYRHICHVDWLMYSQSTLSSLVTPHSCPPRLLAIPLYQQR